MRIVHISAQPINKYDGISTVIPKYVKYQSEFTEVFVINLGEQRYEVSPDFKFSYNYEDIKKIGIDKILYESKPTLIVFHGLYYPKMWKLYIKYIHNKIPYIVIPHGGLTKTSQKKSKIKKILANFFIVNKYIDEAKAVQFLSENEKTASSGNYKSKGIVLSNGVERRNIIINKKNDFKSIRLVYIGRIENHYKGLDMLLKACVLIKDIMIKNNVKLDIYGVSTNGDDKKNIKFIEENDLLDVVSINQGVFNEEKEKVLLSSDCFIQTSRSEGQSVGILEALSYGLPILVTEGTGMKYDLTKYECGYICSNDTEGIANMIIKLVSNKSVISKMSEAALDCASQYYWNNVTDKTIMEYYYIVNQ